MIFSTIKLELFKTIQGLLEFKLFIKNINMWSIIEVVSNFPRPLHTSNLQILGLFHFVEKIFCLFGDMIVVLY